MLSRLLSRLNGSYGGFNSPAASQSITARSVVSSRGPGLPRCCDIQACCQSEWAQTRRGQQPHHLLHDIQSHPVCGLYVWVGQCVCVYVQSCSLFVFFSCTSTLGCLCMCALASETVRCITLSVSFCIHSTWLTVYINVCDTVLLMFTLTLEELCVHVVISSFCVGFPLKLHTVCMSKPPLQLPCRLKLPQGICPYSLQIITWIHNHSNFLGLSDIISHLC